MAAEHWSLRGAVLIAWCCGCASAQAQSFHYSDSSSPNKLQSLFGVVAEQDALSLGADVTLIGQGGETEVLPRLTLDSALLEGLDVKTVLRYSDWNDAAPDPHPTVDTKFQFDAGGGLIDAVEGSVRRGDAGGDETLSVRLSALDTGLRLFGGEALGFQSSLSLRDAGDGADAVSTVRSSFGLGSSVEVESAVRLEADEHAIARDPALDTRVVYREPLPFVKRIEGAVAREASGDARTALSLLFPDLANGGDPGSMKLETQATLEELTAPDGADTVKMGLTTKLTGLATPLLGGTNSLILTLERGLDAGPWSRSSLAYDHRWSPGEGSSVGFDLKFDRHPNDLEPTMGIKWLKQF